MIEIYKRGGQTVIEYAATGPGLDEARACAAALSFTVDFAQEREELGGETMTAPIVKYVGGPLPSEWSI